MVINKRKQVIIDLDSEKILKFVLFLIHNRQIFFIDDEFLVIFHDDFFRKDHNAIYINHL